MDTLHGLGHETKTSTAETNEYKEYINYSLVRVKDTMKYPSLGIFSCTYRYTFFMYPCSRIPVSTVSHRNQNIIKIRVSVSKPSRNLFLVLLKAHNILSENIEKFQPTRVYLCIRRHSTCNSPTGLRGTTAGGRTGFLQRRNVIIP